MNSLSFLKFWSSFDYDDEALEFQVIRNLGFYAPYSQSVYPEFIYPSQLGFTL